MAKDSYTKVLNSLINDNSISERARIILMAIMERKNRPGWTISKQELTSVCSCGRDAFNKAWKELLEGGYLVVTRKNTGWGASYNYEVNPEPGNRKTAPRASRCCGFLKSRKPAEPTHGATADIHKTINNTNDDDIRETTTKQEETPIMPTDAAYIANYAPDAVKHDTDFNPVELSAAIRKHYPTIDLQLLAKANTDACRAFNSYKKRISSPWRLFRKILLNAVNMVLHGSKHTAGPADQTPMSAPATAPTVPTAPKKPNRRPGDRFHNFQQRQTDYDALLERLSKGGAMA